MKSMYLESVEDLHICDIKKRFFLFRFEQKFFLFSLLENKYKFKNPFQSFKVILNFAIFLRSLNTLNINLEFFQ